MKAGVFGYGAVVSFVVLAAVALSGCADNTKPQQPGANASADTSIPASKARVAKLCLSDPGRSFGEGNATPARCDCYADGVVKVLSKDQLGYLATYNEVPFNTADDYDKIKDRCLSGGNIADSAADKKAASKKKGGKS
jgi:hypothetical protein